MEKEPIKMSQLFKRSSFLLAGGLLLFSCSGEQGNKATPGTVTDSTQVAREPNPFPFYKSLSVRPGLHFEVVSWGKGVDSVGGYLILMSDSTRNNFKSLSDEREGIITDSWNMDLDNDGNPEIYVELSTGGNQKDLNVYEYAGNSFQKITFPGLSSRAKKTYGGNDQFKIKNGDLFRTYSVVDPDSANKVAEVKTLQYRLRGNTFSVDELSEE